MDTVYFIVIFSLFSILCPSTTDAVLCHTCRYAMSEELEHSVFSTESKEVGFESCKDGKSGLRSVECSGVCKKLSYDLEAKVDGEDTDIEVIIRDCVPRSDVGDLDPSRCHNINDYRSDSQLRRQAEGLLNLDISSIKKSKGKACFCTDSDKCNSATGLATSTLVVLVCMMAALFLEVH